MAVSAARQRQAAAAAATAAAAVAQRGSAAVLAQPPLPEVLPLSSRIIVSMGVYDTPAARHVVGPPVTGRQAPRRPPHPHRLPPPSQQQNNRNQKKDDADGCDKTPGIHGVKLLHQEVESAGLNTKTADPCSSNLLPIFPAFPVEVVTEKTEAVDHPLRASHRADTASSDWASGSNCSHVSCAPGMEGVLSPLPLVDRPFGAQLVTSQNSMNQPQGSDMGFSFMSTPSSSGGEKDHIKLPTSHDVGDTDPLDL
jgi:hypothetical protein